MTTSCYSVGAYPERRRVASLATRRRCAAPPRTWENLARTREMARGRAPCRNRARLRPHRSCSVTCPRLNQQRAIFTRRMLSSSIRVADFIPASSDVKGVLRARWKSLSMFFRQPGANSRNALSLPPRARGKIFSHASACARGKTVCPNCVPNWHSAHVEKTP